MMNGSWNGLYSRMLTIKWIWSIKGSIIIIIPVPGWLLASLLLPSISHHRRLEKFPQDWLTWERPVKNGGGMREGGDGWREKPGLPALTQEVKCLERWESDESLQGRMRRKSQAASLSVGVPVLPQKCCFDMRKIQEWQGEAPALKCCQSASWWGSPGQVLDM